MVIIAKRKSSVSLRSMSLYNKYKNVISNLVCPCEVPEETEFTLKENIAYNAWIFSFDDKLTILHKEDIASLKKV